ncbi:hypothetical protein JCM5350_000393 [Sporobolomyces pararoseus]
MSYTSIPTSRSRSASPDSQHSFSQTRRPSQIAFLPTSPTSVDSPTYSTKEVEDTDDSDYAWKRMNQQEAGGGRGDWQKKKKVLVIALLVPLVVMALTVFAFAANEHEQLPLPLHKVPSWIKEQWRGRPDVQTLLLPRLDAENGTHFSYYPHPLTNPVSPQNHLDFDDKLTIELLPTNVQASTSSSFIFHCAHSNLTYCAEAYRVIFVGPTMHSPSWSDSTQLDERRVEVKFNITDPGEYQIYAWPEHDQCNPFQPELHEWKIRPYFRLAVTGTPAVITVEGAPPVDATRDCTLEDDLTDGRWISRKHINSDHLRDDSPLYDWLQSHLNPLPTSLKTITDYRKFNYIFANYKCKVAHRPFESYVNAIKPDRLLFMGDSITRDQTCMNYGVADQTRGACLYEKWDSPYEKVNKNVPLLRTSDHGTTHISFHWEPLGDPVDAEQYLKGLPAPAPSHIFFEVGLWLTEKEPTPEGYINGIRPFVEALTKHAPNSSIMTRTITSAVQQIACYDRKHIQRRIFEPVNKAFVPFMREEFPQVTVLDPYKLYDDRPETSQDGRHWERVDVDEKWSKPEEGAVTNAMTDIIFETWRLQGLAKKK